MIETEDITRKFDAVIERLNWLLKGKYAHKNGYLEAMRDIYVEARHRAVLFPLVLEALRHANSELEKTGEPVPSKITAALEAAER